MDVSEGNTPPSRVSPSASLSISTILSAIFAIVLPSLGLCNVDDAGQEAGTGGHHEYACDVTTRQGRGVGHQEPTGQCDHGGHAHTDHATEHPCGAHDATASTSAKGSP